MATERITDKPDLSPVLGELEDEQAAALTEQLAGADERLACEKDGGRGSAYSLQSSPNVLILSLGISGIFLLWTV